MPLFLQRALAAVIGRGLTGSLAASVVSWLVKQVNDAREPESLDTSSLRVGETYTVVVRPKPSKAERSARASRDAAAARLERLTRPRGRARRVGLALANAERRAERLSAGRRPHSARARRASARARKRRSTFERLVPSSAEINAATDELAAADAHLARLQSAAFEAARRPGSRRPGSRRPGSRRPGSRRPGSRRVGRRSA